MCGVWAFNAYIQVDWQVPFLDYDFHKTNSSAFRVHADLETLSRVRQLSKSRTKALFPKSIAIHKMNITCFH
jgi:hypothetical protein